MNKILNYLIVLVILVLSISIVYTFGIGGIFSIIFGHCYLLWNKSNQETYITYLKYLVYIALLLSYGYFCVILFLVFFWNN